MDEGLNSQHICYVAAGAKAADALTQGETLEEARQNLIDAVRMMQEPEGPSACGDGRV